MAGPTVTLADIRTMVRLDCRDTSSVQPGISDTNMNLLINRALMDYAAFSDGDDVLFTSASGTLSAGARTASVSFSTTPLSVEAVYLSGVKKLRKSSLHEVLQFQAENPNATGEPDYYAIDAGGSRDSWTVNVDQKADQSYTVVVWYRKEIAALTGTDTVAFGDQAAYTVGRLAAIEASRILGRSGEFIQNLAAGLPEALRARVAVTFRGSTHGGAELRRDP